MALRAADLSCCEPGHGGRWSALRLRCVDGIDGKGGRLLLVVVGCCLVGLDGWSSVGQVFGLVFLLVFLNLFFFLLALVLLTSLDRFIRCRWFDCKPRGWMEEHWIPFDISYFSSFLPICSLVQQASGRAKALSVVFSNSSSSSSSSSGDRLSEPWTLREIFTLLYSLLK